MSTPNLQTRVSACKHCGHKRRPTTLLDVLVAYWLRSLQSVPNPPRALPIWAVRPSY